MSKFNDSKNWSKYAGNRWKYSVNADVYRCYINKSPLTDKLFSKFVSYMIHGNQYYMSTQGDLCSTSEAIKCIKWH